MADGAVKWRLQNHKCWRKRGGVTSSFELIGDGCGISSLRDSGIHFLFGVNLNAAINKSMGCGRCSRLVQNIFKA